MASPHEVLSVDPDADEEEIRRAYRERVKEVHPDQGGSVREFRRVKQAYETLLAGSAAAVDIDVDLDADAGSTGTNGNGNGDGEAKAGGDDTDAGADDADEERPRVEYLNYDVLADEGWSLTDEALFEKAAAADLDPVDYGTFTVAPRETLLEAAEEHGFAWPYSCRGGACANCAVAVIDGEMSMPANHILPPEMLDRGIRLSCVGAPVTDDMKVVFNVKHLPGLDELRLPPDPYESALDD